ncbi:MAG: methylated-DNA--[protein]-cysteine S-methyltransferase [Sphingomonas sp.]
MPGTRRRKCDQHCYRLFETAHGIAAIAWRADGIVSFRLPAPSPNATELALLRQLPNAILDEPPPDVAATIAAAKRYFDGEKTDFSSVPLDLGAQNHFFAQVYETVRRLGWGQITTYGAVARELGAGPEAARDVGQAMASNPIPLIIPCHRVLAAGGKVGGFSAPGGSTSKLKMLAIEGVDLSPPETAQQGFGF